jgi:ketosteroid isomerase-like protein
VSAAAVVRRVVGAIALLWLAVPLAFIGAGVAQAASGAAAEQSLRAAMDRMTAEFRKQSPDMATLSGLIAPNYSHTNGETGEVWDREAWIKFAAARREDLVSGRWRLDSYEFSDIVVRMQGDSAAVVTAILHSSGVRLERPYEYRHRITQLWVQQPVGRWVRAAYHDSPASPGAARVDVYAPERAVLQFEQRRREAVVRKDLQALAAMTDERLRYVDAGGIERTKPEYLEHIRTENIRYNAWSLDGASARVYGDLAVATGTFNYDVNVDARVNKGSQHYTAVYVRHGSDWQLLIWHPTVVLKTP